MDIEARRSLKLPLGQAFSSLIKMRPPFPGAEIDRTSSVMFFSSTSGVFPTPVSVWIF